MIYARPSVAPRWGRFAGVGHVHESSPTPGVDTAGLVSALKAMGWAGAFFTGRANR